MYVVKDLFDTMMDETLPTSEIERFAALEATLSDFVTSRTLDPNYIFLLTPTSDCVWEIRSVQPDPSIRVFGCFAEKDSFVATNYELRKDLKEFESPLWQWSRKKARACWRKIFAPYEPRPETDAKLLISGAIDGQYFK